MVNSFVYYQLLQMIWFFSIKATINSGCLIKIILFIQSTLLEQRDRSLLSLKLAMEVDIAMKVCAAQKMFLACQITP